MCRKCFERDHSYVLSVLVLLFSALSVLARCINLCSVSFPFLIISTFSRKSGTHVQENRTLLLLLPLVTSQIGFVSWTMTFAEKYMHEGDVFSASNVYLPVSLWLVSSQIKNKFVLWTMSSKLTIKIVAFFLGHPV